MKQVQSKSFVKSVSMVVLLAALTACQAAQPAAPAAPAAQPDATAAPTEAPASTAAATEQPAATAAPAAEATAATTDGARQPITIFRGGVAIDWDKDPVVLAIEDKMNVDIKFRTMDWSEIPSVLNLALSTGEKVDIYHHMNTNPQWISDGRSFRWMNTSRQILTRICTR